jgi:molybdopterin converting factor small subunit
MKINVLVFGQLTDDTGSASLLIEDVTNTDDLNRVLHRRFPGLQSKKYAIAVDSKQITGNTLLADNCTVALMPPFSGG